MTRTTPHPKDCGSSYEKKNMFGYVDGQTTDRQKMHHMDGAANGLQINEPRHVISNNVAF